ncbi:hypothetical protein [Streptomyces sp. NPDC055749]
MTTDSPTEAAEQAEATTATAEPRRTLAWASGCVLAAALAVVTVLVWPGPDETPPPYTVPVAYEVTGEGKADITYHAGVSGKKAASGHESSAELPWHRTAAVTPKSGPATVTVQLGGQGGQATCTVLLRGREVQAATASGPYGRATCTAEIPVEDR